MSKAFLISSIETENALIFDKITVFVGSKELLLVFNDDNKIATLVSLEDTIAFSAKLNPSTFIIVTFNGDVRLFSLSSSSVTERSIFNHGDIPCSFAHYNDAFCVGYSDGTLMTGYSDAKSVSFFKLKRRIQSLSLANVNNQTVLFVAYSNFIDVYTYDNTLSLVSSTKCFSYIDQISATSKYLWVLLKDKMIISYTLSIDFELSENMDSQTHVEMSAETSTLLPYSNGVLVCNGNVLIFVGHNDSKHLSYKCEAVCMKSNQVFILSRNTLTKINF